MNPRQRATNAATSFPPSLGRYQVLGHLATGGMAEILLARLEGPGGFQKVVVLKRVLPHLARKSEFRRMFLDEARIVAGLRHANIVQVSELGRDGDELFLVMEYLEGESLARLLKKVYSHAQLPHALSAHIVANACAGLHAAHEYVADGVPQHLVHRDVSPQNLFVTYDGAVKVLDFGVAKAASRYTNTSTGQVKGKFAYMAPEQCLAEAIDRRTDVFALGIVLWESTTGQRLFTRDNELLVFKAICEEPVPRPSSRVPSYPPALEAIVMKALSRRPDDRYATALEMRRDLVNVGRQLTGDRIPEDDLAQLMQGLFADRLTQKSELLRKVGAGENVGSVDWFEISSSTGDGEGGTVDMVADTHTRQSARAAAPDGFVPSAPEPKKSRLGIWIALGVLAILGGAVFVAAITIDFGAPPPAAIARPAAAEEPPPAREAPPPPAQEPARVETVRLDLESTPPGARVLLDGEERGVTPIALALPRADQPIEVTLELEGHRPISERITPDINQRVRFPLERERSARPRPAARPQPLAPARPPPPQQAPPPPRPGGFYRFD